jgi:hypothetical protein
VEEHIAAAAVVEVVVVVVVVAVAEVAAAVEDHRRLAQWCESSAVHLYVLAPVLVHPTPLSSFPKPRRRRLQRSII